MPSDIPMAEDGEEGGVRLWHLVKATEEPEGAKVRRGSLRERERERARAKAIPEIYLTRLLSMKVSVAGELGPRGARWRGRLIKGAPTELGRGHGPKTQRGSPICRQSVGLAMASRAPHPAPHTAPLPYLPGHTTEVCG